MNLKRIFISHAARDKELAGMLQRLFILSGVPRDQIFYSSNRATGVPAGQSSRGVLKDMLRDDPLVVEVITATFMTRPMCLMELGAAWVTGASTFPIVVPPLTREDVISQIGDVHLPKLGSPDDVAELFDELQGRIEEHLGIAMPAAVWNPAVREFSKDLPRVLAGAVEQEATTSKSERVPRREDGVGGEVGAQRLSAELLAHHVTRKDSPFSTEVLGELVNESTRDVQIVMLSATLYDADGAIVGTANGAVNGIAGGQTKTFRLASAARIDGVTTMRLQTDGQM